MVNGVRMCSQSNSGSTHHISIYICMNKFNLKEPLMYIYKINKEIKCNLHNIHM